MYFSVFKQEHISMCYLNYVIILSTKPAVVHIRLYHLFHMDMFDQLSMFGYIIALLMVWFGCTLYIMCSSHLSDIEVLWFKPSSEIFY